MEQNMKNPGLAAVFSFIFSGLGQLYNGQLVKGLLIIFLSALSMLILTGGSILIGCWILGKIIFEKELIFGLVLFLAGLISVCIIGIYSIFDAYRTAQEK